MKDLFQYALTDFFPWWKPITRVLCAAIFFLAGAIGVIGCESNETLSTESTQQGLLLNPALTLTKLNKLTIPKRVTPVPANLGSGRHLLPEEERASCFDQAALGLFYFDNQDRNTSLLNSKHSSFALMSSSEELKEHFERIVLSCFTVASLMFSGGCGDSDDFLDSENDNEWDIRGSDICSKSNSANGDCDPYEAEEHTAKSGCRLAINHAGFSGTGYMDYGGYGTWIEWNNVAAPQAGNYSFTFRYANGRRANRQSALIVNGQRV